MSSKSLSQISKETGFIRGLVTAHEIALRNDARAVASEIYQILKGDTSKLADMAAEERSKYLAEIRNHAS